MQHLWKPYREHKKENVLYSERLLAQYSMSKGHGWYIPYVCSC